MNRPELLTIADLVERWQVSDRTIRHLVAAGELPVVTISPRTRRFRSDDVEAYEASRYLRGAA